LNATAADPVVTPHGEETMDAVGADRRQFLGRSGKLLIYVPPLIQLFIPTKSMAASGGPSTG
jgi:hypothetical protein